MNKQSGFALVEGLLILLILSTAGGAGYYFWNQNQDDGVTTKDTDNPSSQSDTAPCDADGQAYTTDIAQEEPENAETVKANAYIVNVKDQNVGLYIPQGAIADECKGPDYFLVRVVSSDTKPGVAAGLNYTFQVQIYENSTIAELSGNSDIETSININGLNSASVEDTSSESPTATYYFSNDDLTITLKAIGDYPSEVLEAFMRSIRIGQ